MSKPHSKKLSIFIAVLILLVGIFIGGYLVLRSERGVAGQLNEILSGDSLSFKDCQPDPNDASADSDQDGLKDWEEMQIYQSNACQPDSDGDGYLDGEEAASGYSPTKKAPGDELPGRQSKDPRPLPNNLTEALRQKLTAQITQNKITAFNAKGELLSSEELENYPGIQQIIQEISASYTGLFAPDKIDGSQIKTISDNSQASIQRYATMVATVLSSCFSSCDPDPKNRNPETEIFLKAVEENDFSKLNEYLGGYKKAYSGLKELTVPSEFLPLHKEQLEIISSLVKVYEGIEEINTDPLKANLALQAYQPLKEQFVNWLKKLSQFIETHP